MNAQAMERSGLLKINVEGLSFKVCQGLKNIL
jgi:hypothetical protein